MRSIQTKTGHTACVRSEPGLQPQQTYLYAVQWTDQWLTTESSGLQPTDDEQTQHNITVSQPIRSTAKAFVLAMVCFSILACQASNNQCRIPLNVIKHAPTLKTNSVKQYPGVVAFILLRYESHHIFHVKCLNLHPRTQTCCLCQCRSP